MTDLTVRVESLRAAFADVFDGPGFKLVDALIARADALGGEAGDRLRARAVERVGVIEAALACAVDDASRELAGLDEEASAAANAALRRGDARAARRAIRRARFDVVRSCEKVAVPWAARLGGEAAARGMGSLSRDLVDLCASGFVERSAHGRAVALAGAVSLALFRASAQSMRATIALARTADGIPEGAGPYNGQVLAARALLAMAELSPAYLQAVVAAVDDLAALEARLGTEPSKTKPRPARRKRAAAR